ncbi:MAG: alpha/beta fold hydrolase [Candidatus Andersenbacteria bacterium]
MRLTRPQHLEMMVGAEPFTYAGSSGVACLLLHGFTSTPQTLRELALLLQRRGITTRAPLLPGHGTHVTDLNARTWEELEAYAERELLQLCQTHQKIILVGESSGGTIALRLAVKHPDKIAAVVSVGGALVFPFDTVMRTILPVYKHISPMQRKVRVADVCDKRALRERVAYRFIPMHMFHRLLRYSQLAIQDLPELQAPLLILHARQDHSVSPRSAELMRKRAGSRYKKIIWYPRSFHNLLIDLEKQRVFKDIERFVRRIARSRRVVTILPESLGQASRPASTLKVSKDFVIQ